MKFSIRLKGIFTLIGGLILAKFQIYNPLHASELQIETVYTSSTLMFCSIFLTLIGIGMLIGGDRFLQSMENVIKIKDIDNLKFKEVVYPLIFALISCSIYIYIQEQLTAQGYK